jgi:methyltransferase FkbM-like protein
VTTRIMVDVDTLGAMFDGDEALDRLSLIKIDVEGHEIRVVRGARELILGRRPIVAFEVNLSLLAYEEISINEMLSLFLDNDYSLFVEQGGELVPFVWLKERVCNCLAVPNERVVGSRVLALGRSTR